MIKKFFANKARIAVLIAFFTNGALVATWVSRIPALQHNLSMGEGTLGLVLMGLSGGFLIGLLLVDGLIAKLGSKKVVLACALLSCVALPILALAPYPLILFISLLIFGSGISAMDVSMNEQAVLVEREAGKPMISSFHAAYSIGGFAGALIGSGMAAITGESAFLHFLTISILFAALMLFSSKLLVPTKPEPREKEAVFRLPERALWVMGAIAFSSSIGEGASADWSAVFISETLKANASTAALGFAAFSLTMTIGRLIGDWMATRIKPVLIVRWGGLMAAVGFLAVSVSRQPVFAILGFSLIGFGLANIIPMLFSAAGNHPDFAAGTGIAGVATIGYAGYLISPPLIGAIAEFFSLRVALLIVALIMGTLFISGKAIKIKKK